MILSAEQEAIRESVRTFAQERLLPHAGEWDRKAAIPDSVLQQMAEVGLLGICVPQRWGGAGLDQTALVLALEELAAGDAACAATVAVHNTLVCGPLLAFGTEAQKGWWLTQLARGEMLGCFCLTERHAGSDAAAIATHAERVGNEWVLNGGKHFVTNGKGAGVAIVFAITDKVSPRHGMSAFIIPAGTRGYIALAEEQKLGQRACDIAQIVLDNCRIPAENVLGSPGEGYRIALANLEVARIGAAAQAVGMARAAYEAALAYSKQRESFGQSLFAHQAIRFRLADMATEIEVARQMVLHVAALRDFRRPCMKEASMAKLYASEMAERVCSNALQVHGGYGYVGESKVERIYRDVRACQISEGTSDVQRMVIGRAISDD